MDNKKVAKIEKEIYNSLKEKIENLSDSEAEKIIREEVKKRDYLQEDWQIDYAVKRIKKKKDEPNLDTENNKKPEKEEKGFRFYLLPQGTPKQLAKKGLIISVVCGIISELLSGAPLADIFDILAGYGGLLLLIALIKKVKN